MNPNSTRSTRKCLRFEQCSTVGFHEDNRRRRIGARSEASKDERSRPETDRRCDQEKMGGAEESESEGREVDELLR
jgi:hypothetical protein